MKIDNNPCCSKKKKKSQNFATCPFVSFSNIQAKQYIYTDKQTNVI